MWQHFQNKPYKMVHVRIGCWQWYRHSMQILISIPLIEMVHLKIWKINCQQLTLIKMFKIGKSLPIVNIRCPKSRLMRLLKNENEFDHHYEKKNMNLLHRWFMAKFMSPVINGVTANISDIVRIGDAEFDCRSGYVLNPKIRSVAWHATIDFITFLRDIMTRIFTEKFLPDV